MTSALRPRLPEARDGVTPQLMPRPQPLRRVPLMPLAGLAIALIAGITAIGLSLAIARANRWVAHSIQTQVLIAQVGERMAAFESAFRGYLVNANPELIPEMVGERRKLLSSARTLARQTADNPLQQRLLAELRPLIAQRVNGMSDAAHDRPDAERWRRRLAYSNRTTIRLRNQIRIGLAAMFNEEQRLLIRRQRDTEWLTNGLGGGLAVAVLLVVVVAYLLTRDAQRRYAALQAAHDETRAEMTARQKAEAQVAQMQKIETLGQLTGGIAHDFNNMLAVIVGSLDLARRHAAGAPERVAGYVDAARQGADRAAELVTRLLAFARRQPLSPAPIDLNALVAGMSQLLERTLGERVTIETHLAADAPAAFADRGQVENAILNLAVNGRDAMAGSPGVITIVTDVAQFGAGQSDIAPGRYVMVAVADTGQGMSPETIGRAIEPFFTTKAAGHGTGLGLSQVFGFAKQSGGHVAIESRLGEGTVVRLYLPRFDGAAAAPAGEPRIDPPRGRGERVLLVEDEPLVRAFSGEALRDLGYDVVIAADARAALRIVADDPGIDLLFTDIIMPDLSGEDVAARARAVRPGLKLLYTSGYRGGATPGAAHVDGVALLSKPFTLAQLAAHVRAAIDG